MKNSKLINILATFSKSELKAFERLIRSPYLNIERDVTGLFSIIKENFPALDSPALEKENIQNTLFPGEKPNPKKLNNIITELTRLADKFLIYEHINADEYNSERFLAMQYLERKNEKLLSRSIKTLEKKLENSLIDSIDLFRREEKIERLKIEYYVPKNDFNNAIVSMNKYDEYTVLSFLIAFLRSLRSNVQFSDVYGSTPEAILFDSMGDSLDLDKLFKNLQKKKYKHLWLVQLYYYCYLSTKNLEDEKSYRKFVKIFFDNIDKFSRREKYFFFSDMVTFCIRNEYRGNTSYEKEEMDVYRAMMAENAFTTSENDNMSLVLFRNIMLLSLSLREFEWLDKFIEQYSPKLKPEFAENMKVLARAYLNFELGKFESALDYIGRIKYDIFIYKYDVKNLFLKVFYELEMFEQAYSMVGTYREYLKNNKENVESYQLQFKNFLKFYQKLLRNRTGTKSLDANELIKEINSTDPVSSRSWLLHKINEL